MPDTYEHLYQHGQMCVAHLFNSAIEKIPHYDIAEMNLISGAGLPGTENFDIEQGLKTLDQWAAKIRKETARSLPQFHADKARFEFSRAIFNITIMICTLTREFGIRYDPEFAVTPVANPEPITDNSIVFIHGLLGPKRTGTCSSIPVLLVAIGRRLGYPLKLVLSPQHAFCRWDSPEERFNIEFSANGFNNYKDDYYKTWPFVWPQAIHDRERQRPYFLLSLTPQQELASFAFNRGVSLDIVGGRRRAEALAAMRVAQRLWPASIHAIWITHLTTKLNYPERQWPQDPCEETAGKSAMERLVREKGAVMAAMPQA